MVWVSLSVIDSTDIVVIHSMLNILKILMSSWHTKLEKMIVYLFLWVLELISQLFILGIDLLSHCHFSHLIVDLSQLLHFKVMFSDQVFFMLSQISQVSSWRSSVYLA